MSASLTLDKSGLEKLARRFSDPSVRERILKIPQMKDLAAIVAQAIYDNFDKEGPGWTPLKPETIRRSVAKEKQAQVAKMSNAQLVAYEARARKQGTSESELGPNRLILQNTRTLRRSVTEVNGKQNIWKTEGTTLIWGTDLIYAGVHNNGNPGRHIPQRKFLTIRDEWMKDLQDFVVEQAFKIVVEKLIRGNS